MASIEEAKQIKERTPWTLSILPQTKEWREHEIPFQIVEEKLIPRSIKTQSALPSFPVHQVGPSSSSTTTTTTTTCSNSSTNQSEDVRLFRAFSTQRALDWLIHSARWVPIQLFDSTVFFQWAQHQVESVLPQNHEYQLRAAVTKIIRTHKDEHATLTQQKKAAWQAYENHPLRGQIAAIEKRIEGLQKKGANLRLILETGSIPQKGKSPKPLPIERITQIAKDLDDSELQKRAAEQELQSLQSQDPAATWISANEAFMAFRCRTGIDALDIQRKAESKQAGGRAQAHGQSFEPIALRLFEQTVLPTFGPPPPGYARHMLSNLTLGLSRNEIDGLAVLKQIDDEEAPVIVEALIECKKNPADVAFSFRGFSPLLAFFKNETERYQLADFKNKCYPDGQFKRKVFRDPKTQQDFLLTPESFQRFTYDPVGQHYLDHIYFIVAKRRMQRLSSENEKKLAARFYSHSDIDLADVTTTPIEVISEIINDIKNKGEEPDPIEIFKLFQVEDRFKQILFVEEGQVKFDDYQNFFL